MPQNLPQNLVLDHRSTWICPGRCPGQIVDQIDLDASGGRHHRGIGRHRRRVTHSTASAACQQERRCRRQRCSEQPQGVLLAHRCAFPLLETWSLRYGHKYRMLCLSSENKYGDITAEASTRRRPRRRAVEPTLYWLDLRRYPISGLVAGHDSKAVRAAVKANVWQTLISQLQSGGGRRNADSWRRRTSARK